MSNFPNLKCPITGLTLYYNNNEKIKKYYNSFLNDKNLIISSLLTTYDESIYYPVLNEIYILKPEFLYDINKNNLSPNLFKYDDFTNKNNWYANYLNKYAKWKINFINSSINKENLNCATIVEFMCASGESLNEIYKLNKLKNYVFIGVDFEISHLLLLKKNYPQFIAICANAEDRIFLEDSIDAAFSNSVHHLNDAAKFYDNINLYLKSKAIFIGVESYGLISKIILSIINISPLWILPYSLHEIKVEYNLLNVWLSKAKYLLNNISNINKKINLTHVKYTIQKK